MIFKTKQLQIGLVLKIRMCDSFITERNRIHHLCNKDIWLSRTNVTHDEVSFIRGDFWPHRHGLRKSQDEIHICKDSWMIAYLVKVHVLNLCKLFSRFISADSTGLCAASGAPTSWWWVHRRRAPYALRAVCASANEEPWQGQTLGTSRVPVSSFVLQAPSNSTSHLSPSPGVSFPLTVSSKFLFL